MKKIKKIEHEYLINLYYSVGDYLSSSNNNEAELPGIVVSFCTICEKLFKLMLYRKNPVLVFDNSKMKDDNSIVAIAKKINIKIETIKMRDVINRFNLFFKNKFSEDEIQSILSLYNIRNELIHGYVVDKEALLDKDDTIKKMGTVWSKISEEIISFFGNTEIRLSKPKKKYTESELERVLEEEVKKKIKNENENLFSIPFLSTAELTPKFADSLGCGHYLERKCPRCGSYDFSLKKSNLNNYAISGYSSGIASLYLCNNCNLELTQKEYDIAKNLKKL